MLSKPFAILGLCLFLGISEMAIAITMKNPAIKKENSHKPVTLFSFVEQVLSVHPAVLSAQVDIDLAKIRVDNSKKLLSMAVLEIQNEEETYNDGVSQTTVWRDIQSVRQEEAALLLKMASANLVSEKERVAGELVAVIVRYLGYRDMNFTAKNRVQLIKKIITSIKSRQDDGKAGESDLYAAEFLLTAANIQHAEISMGLLKAIGDFKALTGTNVDPSALVPAELPQTISRKINLNNLAEQNPRVTIAQLKVKTAKVHIRITNQERHANSNVDESVGAEDDNPLVAVHSSFTLPLRNNFRRHVTTTVHAAVKDEQHAKMVYRQVLGQIEAAKGRYLVMSNSWRLWRETGQKSLNNYLENSEKNWKVDEIGTEQYLDKFQKTHETYLSGIRLRGRVWQAWVDWLVATGSVTKWLASLT